MRPIFKVIFFGVAIFLIFLPGLVVLGGEPTEEPDFALLNKLHPYTIGSEFAIKGIGSKIDDFRVNDDTWDQDSPTIAKDRFGNFVITWHDTRNGNSDVYIQRYDFSGNPIGSNLKVNDDTGTGEQYSPVIAMDSSGNFVIAWEDGRSGYLDIYAQRYDSSGTPIGSNFVVNDDPGTNFRVAPAIGMNSGGNFVVTWVDYRTWWLTYEDIYAQRYDSAGNPIGSNFKVNDEAGLVEQYAPAVAMDALGNFIITWGDQRNVLTYDIYAQRYDLSGNPIGPNFRVDDDAGTSSQGLPAIATDNSHNFVITWQDYRNGNSDIYVQRYDSSGNPLGSNFKVNDDGGTAYQFYPAIGIDGSGNFIITWGDERHGNYDIYAQRYNSSGAPLSSNFKVNEDVGGADLYYPAIGIDSFGNFIITWQDNRNANYDIYTQRYDFSGTPLGANFKVNDDLGPCDQLDPAIATVSSGRFVICWDDCRKGNRDIYAQRYDSSGYGLSSNFKVNDDAVIAWQGSPAIAMDGSGNFVIAWADERNLDGDIYAQRYDSSGIPLDSNFKANDDLGTSPQVSPAIAMNISGNFVITWEDFRNGDHDIYAQRYNFSGNPIGSNFKANDDVGTSNQYSAGVAMDASGNFVITWDDFRNGNHDIYAQRYNSSGNPMGSNFKVNDDAGTSGQLYPSIAMNELGGFVITWEDERNGNLDIYAQRYNSLGLPIGSNFKVNSDAGGAAQEDPACAMDDSGRFVITWKDLRKGNPDIYAQKYNSSGAPLDTNYLVSNPPWGSFDQVAPAVATNNSNIYFAWQDNRSARSWDIYAKVLDWIKPPLCGDVTADGSVDAADVVYLINYLFIHGPAPDPIEAADVNLDGVVNITDVVYLINYLFIGGPPPEC
jgi:hypothetical protein